jgi:VanZ family protein
MPPAPFPPAASRRWLGGLLSVYWLAIFTGTHIPRLPEGFGEGGSDKLLHAAAYFGLMLLCGLYRGWQTDLRWRDYGLLLGIAALYAAGDELLQIPVGRHADVLDWVADLSGAGVGLLTLAGLRWIRRPATRPHVISTE